MNTPPFPARHMPHLSVNLEEITGRLCELASAEQCEHCEPAVSHAIFDIVQLAAQVCGLHAALHAERLRSANLEAAVRAALGAHSDGEIDPFAYLRDELPEITGDDVYGA
jgi:hypothetical protein